MLAFFLFIDAVISNNHCILRNPGSDYNISLSSACFDKIVLHLNCEHNSHLEDIMKYDSNYEFYNKLGESHNFVEHQLNKVKDVMSFIINLVNLIISSNMN